MKLISDDLQTITLLQAWAGSRVLVMVRLLLWAEEGNKHKTLAGPCRALLHDTIAAIPNLILEVLPECGTNQISSTTSGIQATASNRVPA
jgi:hypothetical protein